MNKKISSYEELLDEKLRLQELLLTQKEAVKSNYIVLRDEIRPVTAGIYNIANMFSKVGHRPKTSPLLSFGIDVGTELVLKRFLLGRAGWVLRTIVPFVVKNYSAKILSDQSRPFWNKIRKTFSKGD